MGIAKKIGIFDGVELFSYIKQPKMAKKEVWEMAGVGVGFGITFEINIIHV